MAGDGPGLPADGGQPSVVFVDFDASRGSNGEPLRPAMPSPRLPSPRMTFGGEAPPAELPSLTMPGSSTDGITVTTPADAALHDMAVHAPAAAPRELKTRPSNLSLRVAQRTNSRKRLNGNGSSLSSNLSSFGAPSPADREIARSGSLTGPLGSNPPPVAASFKFRSRMPPFGFDSSSGSLSLEPPVEPSLVEGLQTLEEEEEEPAAVAATEDLRAGRMPPSMRSPDDVLTSGGGASNVFGTSASGDTRGSKSFGESMTGMAVGPSRVVAGGSYRHDLMSQESGTPQHILVHGTVKHVAAAFPVGTMHSLACRVAARLLMSDEEIPEWLKLSTKSRKKKRAVLRQVMVDVCVYVGQNAYAVAAEFVETFEVVGTQADLQLALAEALGNRMDDEGYVAPWKRIGGLDYVPNKPAPEDGPTDHQRASVEIVGRSSIDNGPSQTHPVVGWPLAETPGPSYMDGPSSLHRLPTRYLARNGAEATRAGGGGTPKSVSSTPASPSASHTGTGDHPAYDPFETVIAGWGSAHYIQPPFWSQDEVTVYTRGLSGAAAGANMFLHTVHERESDPELHAIIAQMVNTYGPRLVCAPYQARVRPEDSPSLYEGKSLLHMAILNHDPRLVQFLIERGASVTQRCTGSYFAKGRHNYYGEYPAAFAVCTGQKQIARYLFEAGAPVNGVTDAHGASLLHMAVSSDRLAMYDFLVDDCSADRNALNLDGDTPMQMAIRLNLILFFHHIIYKHRQVVWQYGGRVNYNLFLRDIDGISRATSTVSIRPSSLEVIVQNQYLDLLNASPVVTLLYNKWGRAARGHFLATAATYCAGLVVFTIKCQHSRGNLWSDGPPVLKGPLNNLALCSSDTYSELVQGPNGTTVTELGQGAFNCDQTSNAYTGRQFGRENILLHVGSVIFALIFAAVEMLDMWIFITDRFTREQLRLLHAKDGPKPPQLMAIPGQILADEQLMRTAHKRGRTPMRLERSVNAPAAIDPGAVSVGGQSQLTRSMGGARRRSLVTLADTAPDGLTSRALTKVVSVISTMGTVVHALATVYFPRNPFTLLLWMFIICNFYNFCLWAIVGIDPASHEIELAIGAIAGYCYLLSFLRAVRPIGHFIVIITRIFSVDIVKFAVVYLTFASGFAIAMYLLVREEWVNPVTTFPFEDFTTMGFSLLRVFRHSIGDHMFESSSANTTENGIDVITIICVVAFTIAGSLVMTNLLIAQMNQTYHKVDSEALRFWHLEFAQIILTVERRFGRRSLLQVLQQMLCLRGPRVAPENGAGSLGSKLSAPSTATPAMSLEYTVINVEESVPEDKMSLGDAFEQSVRDQLRRTVQWLAEPGGAAGTLGRTLPTLGEIDSVVDGLLARHLSLAKGNGAPGAVSPVVVDEDALPLMKRTCTSCPAGQECALFSAGMPPRLDETLLSDPPHASVIMAPSPSRAVQLSAQGSIPRASGNSAMPAERTAQDASQELGLTV